MNIVPGKLVAQNKHDMEEDMYRWIVRVQSNDPLEGQSIKQMKCELYIEEQKLSWFHVKRYVILSILNIHFLQDIIFFLFAIETPYLLFLDCQDVLWLAVTTFVI